jgi:hypothetical protein
VRGHRECGLLDLTMRRYDAGCLQLAQLPHAEPHPTVRRDDLKLPAVVCHADVRVPDLPGSLEGDIRMAALPGELAAQRRVMAGLIEFCEVTPLVTSLSVGCSLGRGAADALSDIDAALGIVAECGNAGAGQVQAVESMVVAALPGLARSLTCCGTGSGRLTVPRLVRTHRRPQVPAPRLAVGGAQPDPRGTAPHLGVVGSSDRRAVPMTWPVAGARPRPAEPAAGHRVHRRRARHRGPAPGRARQCRTAYQGQRIRRAAVSG